MTDDRETEVWANRDGRAWRIGGEAEVAWIRENTEVSFAITSAIPPVFEAYATLELPGTGDHISASPLEDPDRHNAGVLAMLSEQSAALVEAGPEQAGAWREREHWNSSLPDLIFPADRSWLLSTLWDDDWTCIGGSRALVDTFLAHPDLRHRAREVDPSLKDATPPGHTAI
jgi:hypothetical protein